MDLNLMTCLGSIDAAGVGQYLLDGAITALKSIYHNMLPIAITVAIPYLATKYKAIMDKQEALLEQQHQQNEINGKHDLFYNLKKELFEDAEKIVLEVEQAYVSTFNGKNFDVAAQQTAYNMAQTKLLASLTDAKKTVLQAGTTDLQGLVKTAIETAVATSTEHAADKATQLPKEMTLDTAK